jgi:hypothetical protein
LDGIELERLSVHIALPASAERAHGDSPVELAAPHTAMAERWVAALPELGPVSINRADATVIPEIEPNSDPTTAQGVTAPCEVVGQFYPHSDVDWVQFDARRGDVFELEVYAHRLGQSLDPRMLVQELTRDEQGQQRVRDVANVDDAGERNRSIGRVDFDISSDDPSYRLAVERDATYRVQLLDQSGLMGDDPRRRYRLAIRRPQPDFELFAVPVVLESPDNPIIVRMGTANLRRGDAIVVEIRAVRRGGFSAPISISATGLPDGVTTRGALLPSGSETTQLVLAAREDASPWCGALRVIGTAQVEDRQVTREARAGVVVWGTDNRQQDVPTFRTASEMVLAVIPELAPASLETPDQVWETSLGGTLEIPIKIARRRNFGGDLQLIAQGLPRELKVEDLAVKGDVTDGKLVLRVTNTNTKPGEYEFLMRADARARLPRDPDAVPTAEAQQHELAARVKQLEEDFARARQAKEAAIRDAAAAEQGSARPAEPGATDGSHPSPPTAAPQRDAARAARRAAEEAADAAEARLKQAQAAKAIADGRLEAAKKANVPRDIPFVTISPPVRLRITGTPLKLTVDPAQATRSGQSVAVPVKVQRLYGFADKVELRLGLPRGIAGLEAGTASLGPDADSGTLSLAVGQSVAPGKYTVVVQARGKFNDVDVQANEPFTLHIEPAVEPQP